MRQNMALNPIKTGIFYTSLANLPLLWMLCVSNPALESFSFLVRDDTSLVHPSLHILIHMRQRSAMSEISLFQLLKQSAGSWRHQGMT